MKLQTDTANAAPTASAAPSPTEFRPYEGGEEQRDGALLMVEAYAAIWIVLMAVVLLGHLKQRALDARIARLERAMDRVIDAHEAEGR